MSNRPIEQRPHLSPTWAAVDMTRCSDGACWCWAEQRTSKNQLDDAKMAMAILKCALGIKSLSEPELFKRLEALWKEARQPDETPARPCCAAIAVGKNFHMGTCPMRDKP